LLTAVVLYPFSIGPATWIVMEWYSPRNLEVFEAVYAPLSWACDRSELTSSAANRYVQFWIDMHFNHTIGRRPP
jgi:hypothetical protein